MRRLMIAVIPLALLVTGCGDDATDTMDMRAGEVAQATDNLTEVSVAHLRWVLATESTERIKFLEQAQYINAENDVSELEYWANEMRSCVNNNDRTASISPIDDLVTEVRRAFALHRLVMAFTDDLVASRAEETRHQWEILALIGELRVQHDLLIQIGGAFDCPRLTQIFAPRQDVPVPPEVQLTFSSDELRSTP